MNKNWDKFTSKEYQEFSFQWGTKVYRVIKPGSWIASFSAPRMYHRMVCGLEDAGFLIKDMINWVYGSGFPKSLDISKAIDKYYGVEFRKGELISENTAMTGGNYTRHYREIIGIRQRHGGGKDDNYMGMTKDPNIIVTAPYTEEAKQWDGWGTGLKPAHEPIVLAQKPYEGTYAENVLKYGVGGLNIDASRIKYQPIGEDSRVYNEDKNVSRGTHKNGTVNIAPDGNEMRMFKRNKGRFPSNFILTHHPECKVVGLKKIGQGKQKHNSEIKRKGFSGNGPYNDLSCGFDVNKCQDLGNYGEEIKEQWDCHPDCPIRMIDEQSGNIASSGRPNLQGKDYNSNGMFKGGQMNLQHMDSGGASRFFYCAKAFKTERNAGLESLKGGYIFDKKELDKTSKGRIVQREHMYCKKCNGDFGISKDGGRKKKCICEEPELAWKVDPKETKNTIATLKPINLMRYLVKLITPPNGIVLDLFAGSGTTGIACIIEDLKYVLIEKRDFFANVIIPLRIKFWSDSNNWNILKDHPLLKKINVKINKKQNIQLDKWFK